MRFFRKDAILSIYHLSFILVFILLGNISAQQFNHHRRLKDVLKPDGSIKPGATGSFKTKGYDLEFDQSGKPVLKNSSLNKTAATASWNSLGTGRKGITRIDGVPGEVYTMAINSDGDIYLGGDFGFIGDLKVNNIVKFDVSEGNWAVLPCGSTNGVNGKVETIAIHGSDVYAAGGFLNLADETEVKYIAKFSETTYTWSRLIDDDAGFYGINDEFMMAVNQGIYDMGFMGDVLYIGGDFIKLGDGTTVANHAAKWDGTDWYPLTSVSSINGVGINSTSSTNFIDALEVDGDRVYIGGGFATLGDGTTPAKNIAVWDETNDTWSSLTYNGINGISGEVYDIKISGSTVYVGGYFSTLGDGTTPAVNIAQWVDGAGWSALISGSSYGVDDDVLTILNDGTDIYIGGAFTQLDEDAGTYNCIIKWDGSNWSPVTNSSNTINGVAGPVIYSLCKDGDNLYLGGIFMHLGDNSTLANSFTLWNITSGEWDTYGTGDNGVDGTIRAVLVNGDYIYTGGYFTSINGGALPAKYVARWNYNTEEWSVLSSSTSGIDFAPACSVFAMAASGNYLYIAGKFATINGGTPTGNIARYNLLDGTWSALSDGTNIGVNNRIAAIKIVGDDIYVGGDFTTLSSGTTARYIAKWNESTGWSAVNNSEANGINNRLLCMAKNGNLIYFGGYFNNVICFNTGTNTWATLTDPAGLFTPNRTRSIALNGEEVYIACDNYGKYVAKWDGTSWTNLTENLYSPSGPIYSISFCGNELYAGGGFFSTNELPPSSLEGLMKWNSATGWETLASTGSTSTGTNRVIYTLVPNETEGKMYVGGEFSLAGGKAAFYIASFSDDSNPLPVELTSFTAASADNSIQLNWSTATELNNYGFQILRKNDKVKSEWEEVGFVEGSGNSNSPKEYSFVDVNPLPGNLLYRLKQIDTDGSFKYYNEIAEVNYYLTDVKEKQLPKIFGLSQNFPNPFNPETVISYKIPVSCHVTMKVYDVLGNEVTAIVDEVKAPGYYKVKFNGSSLASGVYIYRLNAENFTSTKKLIIMK